MSENYKCYQQGYMDVCAKFGDKVPATMLLDDDQVVDEDSDAFNQVAYLQGQMNALLEHFKTAKKK